MGNIIPFTPAPFILKRRAIAITYTMNRQYRAMVFLPSGNVWRSMPLKTNFILGFHSADYPAYRMDFSGAEKPPVQKCKNPVELQSGLRDIAGVHDFKISNQGLQF